MKISNSRFRIKFQSYAKKFHWNDNRFIRSIIFGLCLCVLPLIVTAQLPIAEIPWEKGELLYANSLAKASLMGDWVMEGPGEISFEDGWMHMQAPDEAHHHVFWCPRDFPDRFVAEWEMQNIETDAGLAIVFFAATGTKGESIFDPNLPRRDGTFRQYTRGSLNNYHISYYANTPGNPGRGDSHIRKNQGFALIQTGQEGIPTKSTAIHQLRLIKDKGHIRLYVDGRKLVDWIDKGKDHGPVWGAGKIGLRQMQWTHFRYRNFRVWELGRSSAEIKLTTRVLHPRFREWVSPADGQIAKNNPPVLLCPSKQKPKGTYAFRLSKDKKFPKEKTLGDSGLPWAIFNPHHKLGGGIWYWQYRIENRDWSETFSFFISDVVPVAETPDAQALITAIPKSHPRLLAFADQLDSIRSRAGSADALPIIQRADDLLDTPPPSESLGIPALASTDKIEQDKHRKDASKKLGTAVRNGIEPLSQAYLLTGEKRYAKAAIRWAMEVASWDPDGVSYANNFADSDCMLAMAMAYDACFDMLSKKQKGTLETAIHARAHRFYNDWLSVIETKVFSAHVWQHIIERVFKSALALRGEVPDADLWLIYIYELWLARAPVLGPADGGWWNGNHYMELGGLTLMEIPMILEKLTGANYYRSPFYQNNPWWLTYSFPPNSYSEGFGNGTEKQFGQKLGVLGFMDALGRKLDLPHARAYADIHLKSLGKSLADDDEFRWYRLRWLQNERPQAFRLSKLPQARFFPLTGSVNMHTDLENPAKNLMLSMRSSPYGSTSHSHADQNGFNIQYGGQKLFYNSGYRPSMGVPHYEQWFKATIGHNSVLIDGKGQPTGSAESYGWLPRFLHGEQISYCLGDASMAYDNVKEKRQTTELKRFRRHLLLLRPSTIVIYDELEAAHEAEWSWLLHSHEEITLEKSVNRLFCKTAQARSQVDFPGMQNLNIELSTEFDPKPINFRGLKDEAGKLVEYKDQWHIYAKPQQPQSKMRYLAVFQIKDQDDKSAFATPVSLKDGGWQVEDWVIRAELDGEKNPMLEVTKPDGTAALGYGVEALQLGKQTFIPEVSGSTILGEVIDGKPKIQEAVDVLPEAVRDITRD